MPDTLPVPSLRTLLLTPGPLTTSDPVRAAMGRDWGSRDRDFAALSEGARARLLRLVDGEPTHACVPLQGAGTYAVEAAVGTLVLRDGALLVLVNGAYGRRAAEIARRLGRRTEELRWDEDKPCDPAVVEQALLADSGLTDVLLVHLETTSGLLNPLGPVADAVARQGRRLHVDAMASFGALPISLRAIRAASVIASANKCLEGVPGVAFVIAEQAHLAACAGNSLSVSLDLHAQWRGFETNGGQWRFTPPTHVVAALAAALDGLDREGGVAARGARYRRNMDVLLEGMARLGFAPYLLPELQGPVIATFHLPPWLDWDAMYAALHRRGIVLYPGKLTQAPSFRIGCIGAVDETDMRRALAEIGRFLDAPTPPVAPPPTRRGTP